MIMPGDSFSFGKYNSVNDWGIMVVAHDTFIPSKRARKIVIPGRSGSYDYGAKNWDERGIRLECTLMRKMSKSEFREIVYALSKKRQLRIWNEPDKFYVAELYDPADVIEYYLEAAREFELDFIAEPFAYGETVIQPIKSGVNTIQYKGTAAAPCTIILKNTSTTTAKNITITAIKRN